MCSKVGELDSASRVGVIMLAMESLINAVPIVLFCAVVWDCFCRWVKLQSKRIEFGEDITRIGTELATLQGLVDREFESATEARRKLAGRMGEQYVELGDRLQVLDDKYSKVASHAVANGQRRRMGLAGVGGV